MKKRITLYADEGKVLTNGTDYGQKTTLEVGLTGDDWYEITKEEYDTILAKKEAEMREQNGEH